MVLTLIIAAAALILGGICGYAVFRFVLKGKYNEIVTSAEKGEGRTEVLDYIETINKSLIQTP